MIGAAYAQAQGGSASGGWMSLVPIVLMIVIFYFLLIRPQQKKEKQRVSMVNSLQKGDRVITSSGMYGVVQSINNDIVVLKIGTNTSVEFAKAAIQGKVS